jgi:hypothetical protein
MFSSLCTGDATIDELVQCLFLKTGNRSPILNPTSVRRSVVGSNVFYGRIATMNVPPLPVDSLYKFLAVAGIVTFLSSTYLNYVITEQLLEKDYNLSLEVNQLALEAQFLAAKSEKINAALRSMTEEPSPSPLSKGGNRQWRLGPRTTLAIKRRRKRWRRK